MADPRPTQASRRPTCPICGKPPIPGNRPFCSARCADIDLGRWFGETYRIPGPPAAPDDDDNMTG